MHKHKPRSEGILYEAPNTRDKINDEVREELAGTETCFNRYSRLKIGIRKPRQIETVVKYT